MTALRGLTAAPLLRAALATAPIGPDRLDDLAARVADAVESPLLAILLAELSQTPNALAEVAARSYWHSNGFAKLVLDADEDPDGRKLRLHVWPDSGGWGGPRGASDPHGHRWDFASTVLTGDGLDLVEYEEVDHDGELWGGYEYDPRVGLRGGIEVQLRETTTSVRLRGDVYPCDTDVLHTVEPRGSGVAATLVVQGPVSRDSTWVYRREITPYQRPRPLAPSEVARLVRLVLDRL